MIVLKIHVLRRDVECRTLWRTSYIHVFIQQLYFKEKVQKVHFIFIENNFFVKLFQFFDE